MNETTGPALKTRRSVGAARSTMVCSVAGSRCTGSGSSGVPGAASSAMRVYPAFSKGGRVTHLLSETCSAIGTSTARVRAIVAAQNLGRGRHLFMQWRERNHTAAQETAGAKAAGRCLRP
jgi:hypothetical protein